MAWLELHTVLIRHRKTKALARSLGIKTVLAVGHLTTLWANVLELAEDGDISKWSFADIAAYAEYEGDPIEFFNALVAGGGGWVDEIDGKRIMHDWWDYAGRYLKAKYRTHNPEKLKNIEEFYSQIKDRLRSDFGRLSNQSYQSNQSSKQQPSAADAALNKVYKNDFNIYALLNKLKKALKWPKEQKFPDEVIVKVCDQYWKDKPRVKKAWPWFVKVFSQESAQYFANKNIKENERYKGQQIAEGIKNLIFKALEKKGG